MYRLLEVGEVIEKGDEYWSSDGWRRYQHEIGNPFVPGRTDHPSRRLVKPAVTPAATSVPAPVVSVGDHVKVLTGPWSGCTGVVDVPWGKLNQKTCSFDLEAVSVRFDNVFVGGSRLTVITPVSQVEKLPPVVPEVLYRDLSHGEIIRKGDEIRLRTCDKWEPAGLSGGSTVGSNLSDGSVYLFRRPVRLQSPGWRYLDAGETVKAGDETFCENVGFWPLIIVNGSQVKNEKLFRRKLPANQGG